MARTEDSAPLQAGSLMTMSDDCRVQDSVAGGSIEEDLIRLVRDGGFESSLHFIKR
ncbi:XdhC family protein [Undibacterium sp. TJN25]|uniref:XdhC family protein n=1 Tax=Undibacterium sp. TJN25 TaxID=3413056 RepID=UPI003BF124F8